MAVSLLAYVANFSGQMYFWRNYFFILHQCNYFDTKVIFSEPLFLQRCYFFWGTLLSSHLLRNDSCLGQLLFGTLTFLVGKLFRTKKFSEEVLFWTTHFCSFFSEELLFRKSYFFRKCNIPHCPLSLDSRRATFWQHNFSEEIILHRCYYVSYLSISD